MTEGRDLRTFSEENLVVKRAKLIEYQNRISWIAIQYRNIFIKNSVIDNETCVILYENLNSILLNLKEEGLFSYLSGEYERSINSLLDELKLASGKGVFLSEEYYKQ